MTRDEAHADAVLDFDGPPPKACMKCGGTGFVTDYRSEPETCANCAFGDCDYGHAYERACWECRGTGRAGVWRR